MYIPAGSVSVSLNKAAEENGLYPIRTVSQLTGVNPITLRAWERRYGLIQPLRTEKGHRLYSRRDIETIQQIVRLLEQGMAISQVSALLAQSRAEVPLSAHPSVSSAAPGSSWDGAYEEALSNLDEARLDALESEALSFTHPDALLEHQLLPRIDGMEAARQHDARTNAQYHFLQTRLIRLLAQRASAHCPPPLAPRVLVASLPPERGLFFLWRLTWSLRREGIHAHLLGSGVTAQTLLQALRMAPVQSLLLAFEHQPPAAVIGTQLPLLRQARQPVLACGPYALTMRAELEGMGLRLPPSADMTAAEFVRATLT